MFDSCQIINSIGIIHFSVYTAISGQKESKIVANYVVIMKAEKNGFVGMKHAIGSLEKRRQLRLDTYKDIRYIFL